jgi:hypothetical protein
MYLVFSLSMPGCPSWNGRWSGEGRLYAIVKSFSSKKGVLHAEEILKQKFFSYGWSDGWRACVEVSICDTSKARQIRKRSAGFCGYDWMVNSILCRGYIKADHEPERAASHKLAQ